MCVWVLRVLCALELESVFTGTYDRWYRTDRATHDTPALHIVHPLLI